MDFNSALVLPAVLPHVDDGVGRLDLVLLTQGRLLPGLSVKKLELRSKRLLKYLRCGKLQGSQTAGSDYPYYTEMISHELAHASLLGVPWETKYLATVISVKTKKLGTVVSNTQEHQAAAVTMLVLEYLGLHYDVFKLILSTSQNLRREYITARVVYLAVKMWRGDQMVQRIARQIACRLLKMKYVEAEEAS